MPRKSVLERFNEQYVIDPERGCWIWRGYKRGKGYGGLSVNNRPKPAHRVAYELFQGKIPKGMHVLHKCDNRLCVNPAHLYLGTNDDNIQDKINKNRQIRGESHGNAKLTEQQVLDIVKDTRSTRLIAEAYKIGQTQIKRIKAGTTWSLVIRPLTPIKRFLDARCKNKSKS